MKRAVLLSLLTGLTLAGPALAHDLHAIQSETEKKMRTLGLDVGNAYACVAEDQKEAFRGEARHLFYHVLEDHGPDAAYDYAASVGFGAARDLQTIDCEQRLAYWTELKKTLGLEEKQ